MDFTRLIETNSVRHVLCIDRPLLHCCMPAMLLEAKRLTYGVYIAMLINAAFHSTLTNKMTGEANFVPSRLRFA